MCNNENSSREFKKYLSEVGMLETDALINLAKADDIFERNSDFNEKDSAIIIEIVRRELTKYNIHRERSFLRNLKNMTIPAISKEVVKNVYETHKEEIKEASYISVLAGWEFEHEQNNVF